MLAHENKAREEGYRLVIGVDEAGRGPLAGPVVACAITLKDFKFQNKIADSKQITALQRENAFLEIYEKAYVGIGIISESVIDQKNILEATFDAMTMAVMQLIAKVPKSRNKRKNFHQDVCLLIDGPRFKSDLPYAYKTIVKGDCSVLSIACASIVAKVTRDRILNMYDQVFPKYGFKQHKGYGTVQHKQAIKKFGLSIIHRKSFKCV